MREGTWKVESRGPTSLAPGGGGVHEVVFLDTLAAMGKAYRARVVARCKLEGVLRYVGDPLREEWDETSKDLPPLYRWWRLPTSKPPEPRKTRLADTLLAVESRARAAPAGKGETVTTTVYMKSCDGAWAQEDYPDLHVHLTDS